MTSLCLRVLVSVVAIFFASSVAFGSSRVDVRDGIPASAPWVVVADHIGQQSTTVRAILDRFKSIVSELGSEKISAQLKEITGEDLASPQGMIAYGIDPEGSAALWADDFEKDPYVVIPLSNPNKFIERFSRRQKLRTNGAGLSKPKIQGGVKIYSMKGESFGIKDGYMVMEPSGGGHTGIKNFFSRGKKLGHDAAFKAVLGGISKQCDGLAYFSVAYLTKAWRQDQKDFRKRIRGSLKKSSGSTKKMFSEQLSGSIKTQRRFDKLLAGFQGIGVWWQVRTDRIEAGALFATTSIGQKIMKKVFPSPSFMPGFHKAMLRSSMMGGWSCVSLKAFINWIGDLPQAPWITTKDELMRFAKEFKDEVKMDLFSDFIANFKEPFGAYILSPSMDELNPDLSIDDQLAHLVRLVLVSQVFDAAKAKFLLGRFDAMADKSSAKFEHPQVQGVTISRFTMRSSSEVMNWGLSGDHLMFGMGTDPFTALLKFLSEHKAVSSDMWGEFHLGIPSINEVISSAVTKGVGGTGGMQLRMMWPIVKQVIGRFGAMDFKGYFRKNIVEITVGLNMH